MLGGVGVFLRLNSALPSGGGFGYVSALMIGFRFFISRCSQVILPSALFAISSCQSGAGRSEVRVGSMTPEPSASVTRTECLRIAEEYATFKWRASAANTLHGNDPRGIRVYTPDDLYRPAGGFAGWWKLDAINEGLPYKWGGFDTVQSFAEGIRQGRPAGDAFTAQKRDMNNSAVSSHAVGVDCSGLVARCWRMPASFSTYEIAKHCDRLPDYEALRPGDVVNKEHEHISIFVEWQDAKHEIMTVYDAGCPPNLRVVKHGTYTSYLKSKGYQAWRYRGITD
jgi:hypothetical protein